MKDRIDHGMLCAERLHMRFNLLWQRLLFAFAMLFCGIAGADELPDLLLWKPNDWPAAVYTAGEAGTKMAKTVFTRGTPIYFNVFCGNGGNGVPGVDFDILWEILDANKVPVHTQTYPINGDDPAKTTPNRFFYWGDYSWISTDSLPVGSYTYRMTMDSGNTVVESDESNNVAEFAFRITDNPVYRISLNANGGTLSESTVWREVGETIGGLPKPMFEGHLFVGWFTSESGGDMVDVNESIVSDTVLYAHWRIAGVPDFAIDENHTLTDVNPNGSMSITVPGHVKSIAMYAFSNCVAVTNIVIPDSVTNIAYGALYGCTELQSLTIPDVPRYYWGNLCGLVLLFSPRIKDERYHPGSVPSTLTSICVTRSIGEQAFEYCDRLMNVTIDSGVTNIGNRAFLGCENLMSVTISYGVTDIGDYAFDDCTGLTSVTIPDSVVKIGNYAFRGCTGLTMVMVPQTVCDKGIGYCFSSSISSITNIALSAGVTSNVNISIDFVNLADITVADGNPSYSSSGGILYDKAKRTLVRCPQRLSRPIIHSSVTRIGEDALSGCAGLMEIVIPEGVTNVGDRAFSECTALADVKISGSVESVGDNAFNSCTNMTNLVISSGVKNIGRSAFYGCGNLSSVEIPISVTNVGDSAFGRCISLTSMTIPFVGASRDAGWQSSMLGWFFGTEMQDGTYSAFQADSKYYSIPTNLTSVVLTDQTSVPLGAFMHCRSLSSVVLPDGLLSIGHKAFLGCDGLLDMAIPHGVTYIYDEAFCNCDNLGFIAIPDAVKSIGTSAFSDCRGLTNVMFGANVVGIGNSAFSGCNGLTNVALPAGLTSIGDSVFSGCSSLTSVMIQDGVMSIGNRAFFGCAALPSIILPRALDAIQSCAFGECASLRTVYFQGALAPYVADDIYKDASPALVSYVPTDSTGWEDGTSKLPRLWPVDGTELGRRIVNGEPPRPTVWTVTFDARDGVVDEATRAVTNGCAVGALPSATREGYDFDGWFTAADGGSQLSAGAIVTESATYYAHWTEIPLPPEPIPVPEPSPGAKGFGPGYGSKFAISASEEAHVVGVHGLTWEDFPVREYDGYHVFSDSRIVDRDKGSGADAADHQWCGVYADMVTCVWSGWSQYAGFTDEDAFGRFLVEEEKDDVFGYVAQCAGKDMEPYKNTIKTDATFPQSLAASFESADRLMSTVVCFDNYNWYGSYRELIVHAVVCCGYSLDTAKPLTDPTCLKGLFIIDPDNDRENGGGGAAAPDTITYCPVTWNATTSRYEIENIFGATGYFSDEQYPSITLRTEVPRISRWSEEAQPPPTSDVWTVTFDAHGGVVSESTRAVTNGCAVGTLPETAREDHKLDGWFTAVSGGEAVTSATVITTNVTFYAHWTATGVDDDPTPLPIPNVWTVTFDAQGGVVSESTRAVTNGFAVGTLPETAREDHTFDGWFTAAEGGDAVTAETVVTGDVTYYAHWTKISVPTPVVEEEIYGGKVENNTFYKAQVVLGALYDAEDNLAGTVEVKFGKINAKKQTVKVSGSATLMMDGKAKKITAKAVNVAVDATKRVPPTTLAFKAPIGNMAFAMDADGVFTLKSDKYDMVGMRTRQSASLPVSVGGAMPNGTVYFNMEMDDLPVFGKDGSLISAALPSDVPIRVSGSKWLFDKSPSLKYAKDKTTGKYRLVGLGESSKPNVSGLKLTYTAKTGVFKGTFKLYATTGGDKPKLKKFTVNVIGFVVDGVGYGTATLKKPAGGPWAVTVE